MEHVRVEGDGSRSWEKGIEDPEICNLPLSRAVKNYDITCRVKNILMGKVLYRKMF